MEIPAVKLRYYKFEDLDEIAENNIALKGQDTLIPCGSAYEWDYTSIPADWNSNETKQKIKRTPRVIAVPIDSPFAPNKSEIPNQEQGVFCRTFYKESRESSVIVFIDSDNPTEWIGFVTYQGSVGLNGRRVAVNFEHQFTYVNPKYRGIYLGPIISGMSGYLLSGQFRRLLSKEGCASRYDALELQVNGEPTSQYAAHLIISFANAMNANLKILEIEREEDDEQPLSYVYGGAILEW